MPNCSICGEELKPEQKVCDTCGTSVPTSSAAGVTEALVSGSRPAPPPLSRPIPPAPVAPTAVPIAPTAAPVAAAASHGTSRVCPICQAQYGPDYQDEFCNCGGELVAGPAATKPAAVPQPTVAPSTAAAAVTPSSPAPAPAGPTKPVRPAAGTVCLVVYSEQKEPLHYCPIVKDVTIIGRSDPVRGDFPDLDLSELFDTSVSRRISRKHIMVLRSRTTGTYAIRPLGGNTGTQIEKELATPLQDYPLTSGTRLVLGGVVRLKFEVM
jgi:hypothetical protein